MRRARGFTLIEVMLAVATVVAVGLAWSNATHSLTVRTGKTERTAMMQELATALKEYATSPDAARAPVTGEWNPPLPVLPVDKAFLKTVPGWEKLSIKPEGFLFYSYFFYVQQAPGATSFVIQAEGDLDGNGRINYRTQQWNLESGGWTLVTDTETGDAL